MDYGRWLPQISLEGVLHGWSRGIQSPWLLPDGGRDACLLRQVNYVGKPGQNAACYAAAPAEWTAIGWLCKYSLVPSSMDTREGARSGEGWCSRWTLDLARSITADFIWSVKLHMYSGSTMLPAIILSDGHKVVTLRRMSSLWVLVAVGVCTPPTNTGCMCFVFCPPLVWSFESRGPYTCNLQSWCWQTQRSAEAATW